MQPDNLALNAALFGTDQRSSVQVIVEQFVDASRNGVRVRQIGIGDPTISSEGPGCQTNPVFNDVVCTPFPGTIVVNAAGANDTVVVGGSNVGCAATPGTSVVVNLNGGDDILQASTACGGQASAAGVNILHPVFSATGGTGQDAMPGGRL